ncbi:TIGR03915 family putative DNA repair protein [Pedobacter punctiformis]|uniref:TIGR03915 family putative DNA repair protein n=1 Tax=Pedobacter punctiformis TaxID=3004097 RepID=A0ABT4L5G5_9SPHI|nr:TIGR03915 family putative DNA repair protein [Pedobacter sp. HCMS5-2]MCZ4243071.1 TIGR03915 family putative DNA repair protein [Pedobacter sp. HCMS5-2]
MTYIFDGSMPGLLTAVFEWFERKPGKVVLKSIEIFQPEAFAESFTVITDHQKADRVWAGLRKKVNQEWLRKFYCSYLSEIPAAYNHLFHFCLYTFKNAPGAESNYGNEHVMALSKYAKSVEREKHRMEAFIRFQKTSDSIFYSAIDPDFNVLPLILIHFKNRYADQQWIIYDLKRKYGLYYNLKEVEEVTMSFTDQMNKKNPDAVFMDEKEELYAVLWKDYFKSANIIARKNTKLHLQHVPKRYWKYLTEKQSS